MRSRPSPRPPSPRSAPTSSPRSAPRSRPRSACSSRSSPTPLLLPSLLSLPPLPLPLPLLSLPSLPSLLPLPSPVLLPSLLELLPPPPLLVPWSELWDSTPSTELSSARLMLRQRQRLTLSSLPLDLEALLESLLPLLPALLLPLLPLPRLPGPAPPRWRGSADRSPSRRSGRWPCPGVCPCPTAWLSLSACLCPRP